MENKLIKINSMEAIDKCILIALIGIGLYAFFALVDWIKNRKG